MTLFNKKYRVETARADWHDYTAGTYFVTICTHHMANYFGEISDDALLCPTPAGTIAIQELITLPTYKPSVTLHIYVVMPNHIHLLLSISDKTMRLSQIIGAFKAAISRKCNASHIPFKWQTRFHDHIVRTPAAFNQIQRYIHNNPKTWAADCFHPHNRP
ncbi:MAG: transposase [Muribaculaceae bacterium]|nr:transposase [Muribaculaceae bacterium]